MVDFDLRTPNSAYRFISESLGMSDADFITEYIIGCEKNHEKFWNRNFSKIESVDFGHIRIMAFHVTGSLDDCDSIKSNGLLNLQVMLREKTRLNNFFEKYDLHFDIGKKVMCYKGKLYNVDYESLKQHDLTGTNVCLEAISHRLYYDFCVNGFLVNDDILSYGTDIHRRPEFIMNLVQMFPELSAMEREWISLMQSYKVDFFALPDQIHRFNFELDNLSDPPYENWINLTDEQKMKKWMYSHAIERAFNSLSETFLYIKDELSIPPNQIISCTKMNLE